MEWLCWVAHSESKIDALAKPDTELYVGSINPTTRQPANPPTN